MREDFRRNSHLIVLLELSSGKRVGVRKRNRREIRKNRERGERGEGHRRRMG